MYSLLILAASAAAFHAPQQRSLALHEDGPTAMSIAWVSQDPFDAQSSGSVSWGLVGGPTTEAPASVHSYTAGPFGWNSTVFWAKMTGLTPGQLHTYTVTANGESSNATTFRAAPVPSATAPVRIGVLADMGSIELFGWLVAEQLIKEHAANPYDMLFLSGDLSYATVDPPHNELQHLWDLWALQNEPFSSTAPFMLTTGNHESTPGSYINSSGTFPLEFAAFSARWRMPGNGNGSYWYSYTYGPATWVAMSSEHDYSTGSPQWQWLDAAFAAVNRTTSPWLFLTLHRPIYSTDNDEVGSHIPGGPLSVAMEPLLKKYAVDCVWQGHEHVYERSTAVYNGTTITSPDATGRYTNPGAPVYITTGNSGADLDVNKWMPRAQTPWNVVQLSYYGFGRLELSVEGSTSLLTFEAADTDGKVRDSWSIAKTAQ